MQPSVLKLTRRPSRAHRPARPLGMTRVPSQDFALKQGPSFASEISPLALWQVGPDSLITLNFLDPGHDDAPKIQ